MDAEEKLRINRINFAGISFVMENLFQKDANVEKKFWELASSQIVPYYQNVLAEKGQEGVIKNFALAAIDALLGLPYTLTDDNKGLTTRYPSESNQSKEYEDNFKAHFKFLCKGGKLIGEKMGAKVNYDENNLTFEMKFD